MVDIPSANQSGGSGGSVNAPPPPDPLALPEGPVVGASSLSPPSPLLSPQGEGGVEGGGREGGGRTHVH